MVSWKSILEYDKHKHLGQNIDVVISKTQFPNELPTYLVLQKILLNSLLNILKIIAYSSIQDINSYKFFNIKNLHNHNIHLNIFLYDHIYL